MSDRIIELNSSFISVGNAVGKKESEGPLGQLFDVCDSDDHFGKDTWEKAEAEMVRSCSEIAIKKAGCRNRRELIVQYYSQLYELPERKFPL